MPEITAYFLGVATGLLFAVVLLLYDIYRESKRQIEKQKDSN